VSGAIRGRALLAMAVSAVVLIAIVAGFMASGTPGEARQRRLDQTRVEDLQAIERSVDQYHREFGALPASLDEMKSRLSLGISLVDPETGAPYEYRPLEGREFELCATYAYASEDDDRSGYVESWRHPAGRHCHRKRATRIP
jgi:hypothetical protein